MICAPVLLRQVCAPGRCTALSGSARGRLWSRRRDNRRSVPARRVVRRRQRPRGHASRCGGRGSLLRSAAPTALRVAGASVGSGRRGRPGRPAAAQRNTSRARCGACQRRYRGLVPSLSHIALPGRPGRAEHGPLWGVRPWSVVGNHRARASRCPRPELELRTTIDGAILVPFATEQHWSRPVAASFAPALTCADTVRPPWTIRLT